MSANKIGMIISELRKSKGITQEELAKSVGVTTQAVSKWECGGTPDIELLPSIADYFDVSVDKLFGRNMQDYAKLDEETAKYIASVNSENRFMTALEHCWAVQVGVSGNGSLDYEHSLDKINEKQGVQRSHSQVLYENGISLMGLSYKLPYFALFPRPENGWGKELNYGEDYRILFETLADPDVFKCLGILYARENKLFTLHLLVKENISADCATVIIEKLSRYGLIKESQIEINDGVQKTYSLNPNPSFIPFLIFASEIINKPNMFYNYYGNSSNKPYLGQCVDSDN